MATIIVILFILAYVIFGVLYTGLINGENDPGVEKLAFELCDMIKAEKCLPLKWSSGLLFIFSNVKSEKLEKLPHFASIQEDGGILFKLFSNKIYFVVKRNTNV